jgi:4-hydroxybenzoate polyprenyltransferase
MNATKTLAIAQLVRLPNVMTAFADVLLGTALCGALVQHTLAALIMMLGSGCLYLAGMALNDYFDRHEDAKTQRFRPIPSGRVKARTALLLGVALMLFGVVFTGLAPVLVQSDRPFLSLSRLLPLALVLLILLYDGPMKHTPLGPLVMGACRFVNVLMATVLLEPNDEQPWLAWHVAGVVGLYITGVTWFARTEETQSQRWQLILAAVVMVKAVLLAVAVPVHYPLGTVNMIYPYLFVGFGILVGRPVLKAIRQPTPRLVQLAIKRSVLALIVLDACLAVAPLGVPGLCIVLLIVPALWLGRWVYST